MAEKETASGTGIRDVARLAGVAPSTVSRVLNNRVDGVRISTATIERVRQAAQTLRYQPNAAARSLRTTRAHTIGVIARDLLHPFTAALLRVVYGTCQARGYHLLLGHAEHDRTEGRVLGDILSADRVDGVLLIGDCLWATGQEEDMVRLIQTHTHVVTVGARPSLAGELSILVDDVRAVTLALEHLVALGHRNIGYIRRSPATTAGPQWEDYQRQNTYRSFLNSAGLPHTPADELLVSNKTEEVREALAGFLARPQRPTALFVNDDMTAIITIKAALTHGVRIPDDLSIIGIDDIPLAALCTPGLTTVRQPIDAMGQFAASYVLDRIAGIETADKPDDNTVFFAPTLVCRESTAYNTLAAPGEGPAAVT